MEHQQVKQTKYIAGAAVAILVIVVAAFVVMEKKDDMTIEFPDEEVIGTEVITQPMPVGGVIQHPEFGKQTYFSYGALSGTEETPASGVVYGRMFEGETYFHTININIQVAPNDAFYQGWLRNDAGAYVKTERLYNRFGDARYSMEFDAKQDLKAYRHVIVSLESSDAVSAPTKVVAQGTLKEAKQGN